MVIFRHREVIANLDLKVLFPPPAETTDLQVWYKGRWIRNSEGQCANALGD
jgi:hypothetical protein